MRFEDKIATLNELYFFREFTFSRNTFRPRPQDEVEFADNVIWLHDLLILYQVKERNAPANTTPEREEKWFRSKVLREATKQIRDTMKYLDQCHQIQLQNQRGHTFDLATASLRARDKVVVYLPHAFLPNECKRLKHHRSTTVGLIHLIQAVDYLGICQTLITPAEVHRYLEFREEMIDRWGDKILDVPEPALVGQYLYDDTTQEPDITYVEYLWALEHDRDEWDMSNFVRVFADRITTNNPPEDYYHIISEIARLKRNDLREFKKRFTRAMENAKRNQFTLPYRMVVPRTGCGFVFVTVTEDVRKHHIQGIKNFSYAHKYDQKLLKCIGVSFAREDENWFSVYWCYIEFPWEYDLDMEQRLAKNNPFRDVRTIQLSRYTFKGNS